MTDAPLLTGVGPATDRPMHAGEELKEQKEEKPMIPPEACQIILNE